MTVPVIAFFNNKGGVGKTTMVYHLAWMFSEQGFRVIAADIDPQSNLSATFLTEEALEDLTNPQRQSGTIFHCVEPLKKGIGDILSPCVQPITERLGLILGDMGLSSFEDPLSEVWPKCSDGDERAFRITSAFWRVLQDAAREHRADVILVDLGPNLGAINRAALIASDFVVIPLGPDLFSLQGLRNLGPALRNWRAAWKERILKNATRDLPLPEGKIHPLGYIVLRHSIRLDRPVKAYERWIAQIPSTYQKNVLEEPEDATVTVESDPHCIARLKDYRSLMPLSQEVRKPTFLLKAADGALGAHTYAVARAYEDFETVARQIRERAGLTPSLE